MITAEGIFHVGAVVQCEGIQHGSVCIDQADPWLVQIVSLAIVHAHHQGGSARTLADSILSQ
jgi:hypothetical protein